MGVYKTVLELIDLRSFSNLWYWIMLGVMWSSASHWVLGVPWDMITKAQRQPGQAQTDALDLTRINIDRMLDIIETSGLWLMGFAAFMITGLGMLAFWYWVEFAQALLLLVAPLGILVMMSVRRARKVRLLLDQWPVVYIQLRNHRILVQLLGMISIFITSMFGMWQNMMIGAPF
ncbi:component of SufBCD complex [Fuscibacter oryzae]|uniref:Component of SufBCD complex n=1 Tax=Fuscibacter oryzae TaxID=2803939 RepID=A0A8J7SRB8_9RHOB|nr:component of SufBCD complex [Fuscibacter oryzae]MBL4927486.1 component of SufBCD complex [Fuscibacter oryzae]